MPSGASPFSRYLKEMRQLKRRHLIISCVDARLRSLGMKDIFRDSRNGNYVLAIKGESNARGFTLGFPGYESEFRSLSTDQESSLLIADPGMGDGNGLDVVVSPSDGNIRLMTERAKVMAGRIFQESDLVFPNFPAPYLYNMHPFLKSHFLLRYLYPGRDRRIGDVIEEATNFALANSDISDVPTIRSDFTMLLRNMITVGVLRGNSVNVAGPKSVSSFERKFLEYYFRKYVIVRPSTLFDYEAL